MIIGYLKIFLAVHGFSTTEFGPSCKLANISFLIIMTRPSTPSVAELNPGNIEILA